jgi:pilus assembly protein CpaF
MVMMANVNLPSRAIHGQMVSALDLIVQVERMRDGTRRITELSEVVGMEQDVITLGNLFTFKYDGQNPDGTVSGRFEATGARPRFLARLEYYGLGAAFMKAVSATGTAT